MATTEILREDEVTVEKLETLFKRAFFKTTLDEDGDLTVFTDGPRVFVMVDEEKKLIKFMSVLGVKESSPLYIKHELANKMNEEVIFVQFFIPEERSDLLIASYYLLYEEGIPAFQIISSLRLFGKVTLAAIDLCDDDNLVE